MKTSATLARLKSDSVIRTTQFVIGVIAIGLIFWQLQFSTSAICCGDFDGYYHIKWTRVLWESIKTHSFVPSFPWLPLTTLNPKQYVDHHLLFHLILIPFARFEDPRLGAKIASIVFADETALKKLNSIVHPYVIRHFEEWKKHYANATYILKEAAILFESGTNEGCDKIITVTAPEELRIQRIMQRDKRTKQDVENIIERQWSDEEKIKRSDFTIVNDDLQMLLPQVLDIHSKLLLLAK